MRRRKKITRKKAGTNEMKQKNTRKNSTQPKAGLWKGQ